MRNTTCLIALRSFPAGFTAAARRTVSAPVTRTPPSEARPSAAAPPMPPANTCLRLRRDSVMVPPSWLPSPTAREYKSPFGHARHPTFYHVSTLGALRRTLTVPNRSAWFGMEPKPRKRHTLGRRRGPSEALTSPTVTRGFPLRTVCVGSHVGATGLEPMTCWLSAIGDQTLC